MVCSVSSERCSAAERPTSLRNSSSSVTSKFSAASSGVSSSARRRSSASACATVRGNPSSTKPAPQSGSARRPITMAITTSSGTRSPRSMYCWAVRPRAVPSATLARKMSPVATSAQPKCSAMRTAWVPLPAPGGPISTTRKARLLPVRPCASWSTQEPFVVPHQQLRLDLLHGLQAHADGDQDGGVAEGELLHLGDGQGDDRQQGDGGQEQGAGQGDPGHGVVEVRGGGPPRP